MDRKVVIERIGDLDERYRFRVTYYNPDGSVHVSYEARRKDIKDDDADWLEMDAE